MKLNAQQRKAVYAATVALLVCALGLGIVKPEQVDTAISQASQILGVIASLLALAHVTPDE